MEKICVIGMGYIGLPTACMFANNGFEVLGVDIDEDIINKLNSGSVHIDEPELEPVFNKVFNDKKIKVSLKPEKSDIFIITVPTPLNFKEADLSYVINASKSIAEYITQNNIVILESTSPPGTTEDVVGKIIFETSGLKPGKDYYLAFCPERVLPGKIIKELVDNDRIIGGIDELSGLKAKEIYSSFVKGDIYLTDLKTTELVKLVENTFRDVNLAFSNELSLICDDYGVDIWKIIEMANKHPRVNILNPGPGVGGHCIPIDPWFILQNIDRKNTLIEKAREINDNMPYIVVEKILNLVKDIENPKISIFGVSYKENVADTRESPALSICDKLKNKNINFSIYDPVASDFKYILSNFSDSLKDSDLLVLMVGHEAYGKIDIKEICNLMRTRKVLDTRNYFDKDLMEKEKFLYYRI